jgi:hypothetical protein
MSIGIVNKFTQLTRMEEYKKILHYALNHDYKLCSLRSWYEAGFFSGGKVLLLRHDVDIDASGAYKMFLIEKEAGVNSTFYFRWKTMNKKIMSLMHNDGFEVSLHFETLASYCKKNNIKEPNSVTSEVISDCRSLLLSEKKKFETEFWDIKTLCSHGDKRNRLINTPNQIIIEGLERKNIGIYFETYDKDILAKFDYYISDSSVKEKHKWKYGTSPFEAIDKNSRTICLLTHPEHWNYSFKSKIHRLLFETQELL